VDILCCIFTKRKKYLKELKVFDSNLRKKLDKKSASILDAGIRFGGEPFLDKNGIGIRCEGWIWLSPEGEWVASHYPFENGLYEVLYGLIKENIGRHPMFPEEYWDWLEEQANPNS